MSLPAGQKRLTVTLKQHEIVDIITGDSLNNLGDFRSLYRDVGETDMKNRLLNFMCNTISGMHGNDG